MTIIKQANWELNLIRCYKLTYYSLFKYTFYLEIVKYRS